MKTLISIFLFTVVISASAMTVDPDNGSAIITQQERAAIQQQFKAFQITIIRLRQKLQVAQGKIQDAKNKCLL